MTLTEWEDDLQWKVTLKDVRTKIELRADMESLRGYQVYQAVAEVASAVFADPKKNPNSGSPEDIPMNRDEALRKFKDMFG